MILLVLAYLILNLSCQSICKFIVIAFLLRSIWIPRVAMLLLKCKASFAWAVVV